MDSVEGDRFTDNQSTQAFTGVNFPSILGSSSALVGFTGGTGGYNAAQSVSNFSFASTAASALTVSYKPLALIGGFNQGVVVPANASQTTPFNSVTASLDGGTSKSGDTFYETGFDTAAPTTGLPASGSLFTAANDPTHQYKMQTYGNGADAMLLTSSNLSGKFTLASPSAFGGLSFLVSSGGGYAEFAVTLSYANGTTSVIDGNVASDWFGNGLNAYTASGRVNSSTQYDSVGTGNPQLFQVDVTPIDTVDPITGITVTLDNPNTTSNVAIFAVSGVAVPEPASLALLGIAGLGLISRRSRSTR